MKKEMKIVNKLYKYCFFCGRAIDGKNSPEHIIPNKLLGVLGIKEQKLSGNSLSQYSRIKVPAHSECNSTFGSRYEEVVINLLKDTEELYSVFLKEEHSIPIVYGPSNDTTNIFTTWLSKIYYGLFYNDFLKTKSEKYRGVCESIIESENFKLVRKSYERGSGFTLPSSLYVFRTNSADFDLVTMIEPSTILLKVKSIVFILCIGDGYLTKNYLNSRNLDSLRNIMQEEESLNGESPTHKFALAEILALRLSIHKTPTFVFSNDQVMNMSFMTGVADPDEYYKIDENELNQNRKEILNQLGFHAK